MSEPPPADPRPVRFSPLRSKTVRFGLFVALVGAAAASYAALRDLDGGVLARGGPAGVRFGLSLAAGYVVGWLFRRVRVAALAAVAALVALAFAAKKLGLLDDPALESGLRDATDRALEGASRAKDLAYGYLPSGLAAAAGGFLGFWSRRPADDRR